MHHVVCSVFHTTSYIYNCVPSTKGCHADQHCSTPGAWTRQSLLAALITIQTHTSLSSFLFLLKRLVLTFSVWKTFLWWKNIVRLHLYMCIYLSCRNQWVKIVYSYWIDSPVSDWLSRSGKTIYSSVAIKTFQNIQTCNLYLLSLRPIRTENSAALRFNM